MAKVQDKLQPFLDENGSTSSQQVTRGLSEEHEGRIGLIKAVKAAIVLIGLAGISYGVLLASIFIRMDPLGGIVGNLRGIHSTSSFE